ncbi:MAG: hypothetical protein QOF78_1953 [Phycisphaerales bacterium]|jgi:hypothetical protein|nr:hypothetical protein [Phycisphaerales bacterium]
MPSQNYLQLVGERIQHIRADLPHLIDLGQRMALPLLKGDGHLFTPQIGTYWPSEFGSRAGGLMGLKPANYVAELENDVAYTTLPDPRRSNLRDDPRWQRLIDGPAEIFIVGRPEDVGDAAPIGRFEGFTGGAGPDEGLYAKDDLRPLAPIRPFEQLVRGWVTAGEMIAAMTRGGRMPIIWMSVWLEGALVRNAAFFRHDNVREPWYPPLFHEKIYVPPLPAGHVAGAFLSELEMLFGGLAKQSKQLSKAGEWMADAVRAGKRISTVLVGHSYPEILEVAEMKNYPLAWLPSISDLQFAHPNDLTAGDVALHLGYAPVDVDDVQKILERGVRFIYTSPYGRPATLKDHENLIWLDLPWRPADATVDVPGYSVRVLPMSSSAHTMVYFSLVCELAERMRWT